MAQAVCQRPVAGAVAVEAEPYSWPYDGRLEPGNTALVVIDMQVDFCGEGGYVDCMGYDISNTRRAIEPIRRLLALCREQGFHVIHTREGHRPDLSNLPANKYWRSRQMGAGIGDEGPQGRVLTVGQRGQDIIPELYPLEGEPVVDKPGKGSFYGTDFEMILRQRGIRNLILTGITTDVCVHTTMREANDRGFECVILRDCTGATDMRNHEAAFSMVKMCGGIFGAVSDSVKVAEALRRSGERARGAPFALKALAGRWCGAGSDFGAQEHFVEALREQQLEITEGAVVATSLDGGEGGAEAASCAWCFEIPREAAAVLAAAGSPGRGAPRLSCFPMGSSFYGQLRGGSAAARWEPVCVTVVDPETIELRLLQRGSAVHLQRLGARAAGAIGGA